MQSLISHLQLRQFLAAQTDSNTPVQSIGRLRRHPCPLDSRTPSLRSPHPRCSDPPHRNHYHIQIPPPFAPLLLLPSSLPHLEPHHLQQPTRLSRPGLSSQRRLPLRHLLHHLLSSLGSAPLRCSPHSLQVLRHFQAPTRLHPLHHSSFLLLAHLPLLRGQPLAILPPRARSWRRPGLSHRQASCARVPAGSG